MKTLNIIGCGQVGRALGRLWHEAEVFKIQEVINRSGVSAGGAVSFIGAGRAVVDLMAVSSADVFMIGTSDSNIQSCASALSESNSIKVGSIVFHCSGALSSTELLALKEKGALVCSAHPVKSFAGVDAYRSFSGTHVALEGDEEAVGILSEAFLSIGGIPFVIPTDSKILYHSALAMVSNYLPSLLEVGVRILGHAGMNSTQALSLIEPLVRGTIDNVFSLGTTDALTGPISRGDVKIVGAHLDALARIDDVSEEELVEIYKLLGKVALGLARKQGRAEDRLLDGVGEVLG